jgi:asparagine synthetase B (glutamine-hydrolysing)
MALLMVLAEQYTRARAVLSGGDFLQEFSQRACAVMSRLSGPFAFLLYDCETQHLWFGRDPVGRRSLLTRTLMLEGCASFCAASVACPRTVDSVSVLASCGEDADCSDESEFAQDEDRSALSSDDGSWVEVPPSGIWLLPLEQLLQCSACAQPRHLPWAAPLHLAPPFTSDSAAECTDAVLSCLESSVRARALLHSGSHGIGILFSGGLDCMIIAALAARCVAANAVIDLFNVAFDAAEAPDRNSACAGVVTTLLIKSLLCACHAH